MSDSESEEYSECSLSDFHIDSDYLNESDVAGNAIEVLSIVTPLDQILIIPAQKLKLILIISMKMIFYEIELIWTLQIATSSTTKMTSTTMTKTRMVASYCFISDNEKMHLWHLMIINQL